MKNGTYIWWGCRALWSTSPEKRNTVRLFRLAEIQRTSCVSLAFEEKKESCLDTMAAEDDEDGRAASVKLRFALTQQRGEEEAGESFYKG